MGLPRLDRDRKVGRSRILRIIDLCRTIERRQADPFEVKVLELLDLLRKHLPLWKLPEEFCLDAEAIKEVAKIIKLQGDWIKHRSSLLYIDSLLLTLKLKRLSSKSLANCLLESMRPMVAIEQITPQRLKEAIEYWNRLMPLRDRMRRIFPQTLPTGSLNIEDFLKLGFISKEAFDETLKKLWKELIEKAEGSKVSYFKFIVSNNYDETVSRAYLTSFLTTYGYATLEMDPISGEFFLIPNVEVKAPSSLEQTSSIAIPLNREVWTRLKEA